ncbi:hypothetical protein VSDG_06642 [Cytospora chrysosperma]|uniref:Zn(2)-C6 fungal-type domain-containing protein n=1 Tax=Cytospora chrysosperma TaxID=252740 RepID=A0A423VNE1_CYTCH|nr:hypothetical protein VSDG_06642 [Valsa sordida]
MKGPESNQPDNSLSYSHIHILMNISNPSKKPSNTCVTCRARKVRCDGNRDICNNCMRLGFTCSYDDCVSHHHQHSNGAAPGIMNPDGATVVAAANDALSIHAVASHPPRRRVRQACQSCHSRKAKCSGTMPKCDRCRNHGLDCVYRPSKRSRLTTTPGTSASQHGRDSLMGDHASGIVGSGACRDGYMSDQSRSASDQLESNGYPSLRHLPPPEESLVIRTFEKFFRHIHHIPLFSYLHQASLMQRYHSGSMDRPLLLSLIGITSTLTDLGPGAREYGNRCISMAELLILRDLDQPTVLKIQAMILIIKHRIFFRRFSDAFMLTGLVSRFAAALHLNHDNPRLCFLAQESRRRLMWSLFMIDIGMAAGQIDFTLWANRPERIDIKLPCNERNFEYDLPEVTEYLAPPPPRPDGSLVPLSDNVGFLALHIRIQWIRSRILAFTKGLVDGHSGKLDLGGIPRKCEELQAELDAFEGRLPVPFKWNEANLRLRAYHPRLCVYLMTHLWWQQCHCDLYRIALVGRRESLSKDSINSLDPAFVKHCQTRCFEHAKAMAEMFALVLQFEKGVPVSDLDLPVLSYQCANTLYYTLATCGHEFDISYATVTEMATSCLKVAKQAAPGPAAGAIAEVLEKLMQTGWVRPTTPSTTTSVSGTPANHEAVAVDPMLQRDALQEADVTHQLYNPAIPQNPPPQVEEAGHAMETDEPREAPTAQMQAQTPGLPREDEPLPNAHAGMIAGVTSNLSNAFEGALDGSNFGMGALEPFAMDSSSWYTGDWMDPDPTRHTGLM